MATDSPARAQEQETLANAISAIIAKLRTEFTPEEQIGKLAELMASAQGSPAAQSLAADWGAKPPPSEPAPAMMGSGVFTGVFELDEINAKTDLDGLAFGDELARIVVQFIADNPV